MIEKNHAPKRVECHCFFQLAKTKCDDVPRSADTMNNEIILQLSIQAANKFNRWVGFGEVESFKLIVVPYGEILLMFVS